MRRLLWLPLLLLLALPASASTSISRIGSCNGTTSCTPPAHTGGDLFVAYAFNKSSITSISLPSGWTSVVSNGVGSTSQLLACKLATTQAETATGFTNATGLIVIVYRGAFVNNVGCNANTVGGSALGAATSATVAYNTFTLTDTGGSSWVIGCAGSVTATNMGTAPTGMTNVTTGNAGAVGCQDTNATATSWSTQTAGVNASAAWQSYTFEIRACSTASCLISEVVGFGGGSAGTIASAATTHGAGHKLIASIGNTTPGTNTSGIANTAGDTWALCSGSRQSTILHTEIWETTNNTNGNAADIVTVTFASNDTNRFVIVYEMTGLLSSACETAAIANASASTTVTSPSFSPANAGNFNVVRVNQQNAATFTAGTGYIIDWDPSTGAEHKIGAAAGSQTASITVGLNNNMGLSVASFKPSVGSIADQVGAFLVGP